MTRDELYILLETVFTEEEGYELGVRNRTEINIKLNKWSIAQAYEHEHNFYFNCSYFNWPIRIPDEQTEDFLYLFKERYFDFCNKKRELENSKSEFMKLTYLKNIKDEIRDFKLKRIGI